MITVKGQGVCGGIAFGKLELLKKSSKLVQRTRTNDVSKEIERFENALSVASKQ